MAKLLMITGLGSATYLASGKKDAFYNTLEEFHKYWTRIDIICPKTNTINSENSKSETLNPKQTQNLKSKTIILFDNVYLHISPWPLIFHPFWFVKKGLEIFKKQKFDLMTVQEFPPFYNGIGAWIVSIFTKTPYVLEIHHIPGYPKAGNIREKIYRQLMSLCIRFDIKRAKVVRVVNQKETPDFLIKAGVPREKIVYIPSAYIDLDIFKPMGLSKKYDLIFVGRLVENKGIDLFIEAMSKLKVKSEKLKVLIVGEGPLVESLKLKVKSLKLENNIIFYGRAKDSSEIAQLLNESKILAMPSYNEGGPRVVVEALACGVPVLATPVGIVSDLLKNGRGGEIIDWDADDIARKALGLLSDPDKYQGYSHSGPEIAKQFERKAAIKNYAEKLQNLIL